MNSHWFGQTTLNVEEINEEYQGWHTFLILTSVLKDFDAIPTNQVRLRGGKSQTIEDVHLKVIKRNMEAYQGKQTHTKRDNTPLKLVAHPLVSFRRYKSPNFKGNPTRWKHNPNHLYYQRCTRHLMFHDSYTQRIILIHI